MMSLNFFMWFWDEPFLVCNKVLLETVDGADSSTCSCPIAMSAISHIFFFFTQISSAFCFCLSVFWYTFKLKLYSYSFPELQTINVYHVHCVLHNNFSRRIFFRNCFEMLLTFFLYLSPCVAKHYRCCELVCYSVVYTTMIKLMH